MEMEEVFNKLLENRRKVVVLGIGNTLRRDDGFGAYVASSLKRFNFEDVLILEAGISPETFLYDILEFKPSHLIIVDTVEANRKPGDVVVARLEEVIDEIAVSTHRLPLTVLVKYLRLMGFNGEVVLIGVQPGDLSFGEAPTLEVKEATRIVTDLLKVALSIKPYE
ncbi:hydrogenase 3 maturation endopeptidase HyCI [Candidatus Bathyarchaeota archaeon]|nr:hydrogenase 3 maturation endopeptidase HyCI [Candidatus Bathyarchaeota archaeon]MBS7618901.1 hydrogenase 3 maturation endopeptidase HyCI [Candidatus Bathyarchaeota archaeon]